ncbi:DMT family transporter [Jeotgalicoccus huakuii]|nr:DMT family transporter [Jeotgalicoccus huakuii]
MIGILGIVIGSGMSFQSAVNSQLRNYVFSPYIASMLSFLVGTILLALVVLSQGLPLFPTFEIITNHPWWIWLGGLCGVIALTGNIIIFPKIGSIETAVMPIIGMIITSMLIDHFGWFESTILPFSLNRFVGVIFILVGVVFAVVLRDTLMNRKLTKDTNSNINKNPWRAVGLFGGAMLAVQAAVNGQLGVAVNSPLTGAFLSFLVGTIILFLLVIFIDKNLKPVSRPFTEKAPIWVWLGGVFGACYVSINILLVGIIGTGPTVVLVLFGQITGSILVQQFGLFRSVKTPTAPIQVLGLIVMLVGVVLINLF